MDHEEVPRSEVLIATHLKDQNNSAKLVLKSIILIKVAIFLIPFAHNDLLSKASKHDENKIESLTHTLHTKYTEESVH